MKSWPTLVPLRHARFYAPKEVVFVTCCQLACKGGVFCCANDNTVFGFNALPASWTLKLTETWGESKNNFGERSPPFCCPNYKTNSKGAFSGKTQKRICDLRSYGFFTTKKTEDPKKDNFPWQQYVLVLLMAKKNKTTTTATTNWSSQRRQEEKAAWATNEYTKCIYFGLKQKRFSNRIHSLGYCKIMRI